jgi:hypothetical protein
MRLVTCVFAATLSLAGLIVADDAATGQHYLAFWKSYFQGEWTVRTVAGDNVGRIAIGTEGTWSCHLAPTKVCMLFSTTTNGRPDSNTIAGFDPSSNAWKEVSFMADGGHLTQFYHAKPADLEGNPSGKVIKGKAKYIYADGRIETAEVSVSILDLDSFDYLVANRRIGDQKLPDLKAPFKRKK